MHHQPDFWGHKERAEEARAVLGSPIYGLAVEELRQAYRQELEALPIGSQSVVIVHAKLKVLDEVSGALQTFVNEHSFREARKA